MKNKKIAIVAISALLAVGLLAGSLAYFSTNYDLNNVFSLNRVGAKFVEEFEAPAEDELVYGNTYKKSGQLINNGGNSVIARSKVTAQWMNKDDIVVDNTLATAPNKLFAATLNFGATADFTTADYVSFNKSVTGAGKWIYNADEYFYYKDVVAAKGRSTKLLESVTFSNEMGESEVVKKYYVKSEYDAWQGDTNKTEPTSYSTQSEASAASNGTAITCIEVRKMIYPALEGAILTVKIEGEIIEYNAENYDTVSKQQNNPWTVDFSFFTN